MRGLLLAAAMATLAACQPPAAPRVAEPELVPPPASGPDLPETREALLERLLPLPKGDVRITYEVSGPIGMRGTLVATARAGGYRAEFWSLSVPLPAMGDVPAGSKVIEGRRVTTPEVIWSSGIDGAPTFRRRGLTDLAEAYMRLEPGLQSLVSHRITRWHEELEAARQLHPGDTDVVQGHSCLVTTVASHRVCVWEAAGLPLSYVGEAFAVRATDVETRVQSDRSTFEIPDRGQRAPDDAPRRSGEELLVALANGDFAELSSVLQPGLKLGAP